MEKSYTLVLQKVSQSFCKNGILAGLHSFTITSFSWTQAWGVRGAPWRPAEPSAPKLDFLPAEAQACFRARCPGPRPEAPRWPETRPDAGPV